MQFRPTPCDGTIQAGAVFRGHALVAEQERAIDLLDMDSTILNRFEGVRVLHQATRRLLRIGVGTFGGVFHRAALMSLQPLIFLVAAFDLIETPYRPVPYAIRCPIDCLRNLLKDLSRSG